MEEEGEKRGGRKTGVSVAFGSVGRWDEEQARDAAATGGREILDFRF